MLVLFSGAVLFGALCIQPTMAMSEETGSIKLDCNNNTEGPRKSIQCSVSQSQLGMTWKGSSNRARKLYIKKSAGDTGQEVVRLWIDGNKSGEVIIDPGYENHLFLKKHSSTISVRVEIETLKLPESGPSTFYFHFETLDPPQIPDLSVCANGLTDGGARVCAKGEF